MKADLPTYLYKYKPIDKYSIDLIAKNEAYFPLPDEFNDPFDCSVVPNPVYSKEDVDRYIEVIKGFGSDYARAIREIEEKGPMEAFFGKWEVYVEEYRKLTRVFSLTERNDNPTMFSHYADGHKGMCLEFKYEAVPFFAQLDKVGYFSEDKYPSVRYFQNDGTETNRILDLAHIHYYTKSNDWNYEQEWRIVRQEDHEGECAHQKEKFPEHILTGIVFGYRSSKEDRDLVRELTKNRSHKLRLMRAVREKRSFKLRIEQLDK